MEIRSNSFEPLRRGANPADITVRTGRRSTRARRSRRAPRTCVPTSPRSGARPTCARSASRPPARSAPTASTTRATSASSASARPSPSTPPRRRPPAAAPTRADSIDIEDGIATKAERAHRARDKRFDRIANAREKVLERLGNTADKVSLSETTLRLRADIEPADPTRTERLAELRSQVQQGTLNTDELIARAAFKLLSGE